MKLQLQYCNLLIQRKGKTFSVSTTHAIKLGCIWHLLIIHLKKYEKKFPSVWFDTVEYLCAPFFFHPFCPLIDDCATHPLTFAGLKFHLILFDDLNFEIGH